MLYITFFQFPKNFAGIMSDLTSIWIALVVLISIAFYDVSQKLYFNKFDWAALWSL
jgi:hypothetical protein